MDRARLAFGLAALMAALALPYLAGPFWTGLVTQMYIAGHPLNAEDGLYQRLGERASLVTVVLEPAPDLEPQSKSGAKRGLFDIVLGPNGVPRDS